MSNEFSLYFSSLFFILAFYLPCLTFISLNHFFVQWATCFEFQLGFDMWEQVNFFTERVYNFLIIEQLIAFTFYFILFLFARTLELLLLNTGYIVSLSFTAILCIIFSLLLQQQVTRWIIQLRFRSTRKIRRVRCTIIFPNSFIIMIIFFTLA